MYKTVLARHSKQFMMVAAGGLVGGMLMASLPVVAQPLEEITVVAPYRAEHKVVGRSSSTGAPVELISLTRHVSYADLDLTKAIDVTVLENRVKAIAKDSCKELEKMYPELTHPAVPSDQNCVKTATDDGMKQVKAAAAAARPK